MSVNPVASSTELDVAELYRQDGARIGRIIERLVGEGPHVDDILHDTFIIAFNKRHVFDSSLGNPRAWLYGIASRECKHYLRSRQRFTAFRAKVSAAQPPVEHAESPETRFERAGNVALVHAVLRKMRFKQREVFILYELEGLDGGSIAEMLGIPLGTVWTRLHHARRSFSRLLREVTDSQEQP